MSEINEVAYEIFLMREIFNGLLIVSMIIFAVFMFLKRRDKELSSAQKNIKLGYCLFLLSYGITRLFFIFSDFEIYSVPPPTSETFMSTIYVGIAYAFGILGAIWLIVMIERYLLHTKYIFTIISIIIFGLSIISIFAIISTDLLTTIIAFSLPVFFGIVVILYLYVAINSTGDVRKRSLGVVLGLLIMMLGFILGSSLMGGILDPIGLYIPRILIEPFVVIVGSAVFTFSQR
jgi:hypothetical protein